MKYDILRISRIDDYHEAADLLARKVEFYAKDGWRPQGGICISSCKVGSSICYTLMQAIIKEDQT